MKKLLMITAVLAAFSLCMAAEDGYTVSPDVILSKGWQAYKKGNVKEAEQIFLFLKTRTTGTVRKRAEAGLKAIRGTNTSAAKSRKAAAEPTAADRLNTEFDAAAKEKDGDALICFLRAHTPPYKDRFLKKIAAEGWNRLNAGQYLTADALFSVSSLSADRELASNSSFGTAVSAMRQGKKDEAARELYPLFTAGYMKDDTAKALASVLPQEDGRRAVLAAYFKDRFYNSDKDRAENLKFYSMMSPDEETLRMADSIKTPMTDTQKQDVDKARLSAAYAIMNSNKAGTKGYIKGLKALLAVRPDDRGGQEARGWLCLSEKQYDCAEESFGRLTSQSPDNENYVFGLASVYRNTGREDKALAMTEKHPSERMNTMHDSILSGKAAELFKNKKYDEAIASIDAVNKPNDDLLRLRAWALYDSGQKKEARAAMKNIYEKNPTPETAKFMTSMADSSINGIKLCLSSLREQDKKFASEKAAEIFGQADMMIAAGHYAGDRSCYKNSGKTILAAGYELNTKSGNSGTSRLTEQSVPMRAVMPVAGAWSATVTEKYMHLDSGSAKSGEYAGKYYIYEDTGAQKHSLRTSDDLLESYAEFTREGDVFYTVGLGSTPAGGEADAVTVFKLAADSGKFGLRFYRRSVGDSLLSVSGLKDPYSDAVWGRVTDTGVSGRYTFDLEGNRWLSTEVSADSYSGKNTRSNSSVSAFAMLGKTYAQKSNDITYGIYASYMSYDNSQNHFTFGNGGYFSPQKYAEGGLAAKIESKNCGGLWYSLRLSGGYQYYKEKSSDIYSETGYDTSSASDFSGKYSSNTGSGLNGSVKGAILKRINGNFAVGAYASASVADQYNEAAAGFVLTFTPSPRNSLSEYKDLLGRNMYNEWER